MTERCHEIEALLSPYLDGELETADVRRVEAHLASCDVCRAVLEAMSAHDAALATSSAHRPEAEWDALAARVEQALDREQADRQRVDEALPAAAPRRFRWWPRTALLGTAGTLALAVIVALLVPWGGPSLVAPPVVLETESADGPVPLRPGAALDEVAAKEEAGFRQDSGSRLEEDLASAARPTAPPPAASPPAASAPAEAVGGLTGGRADESALKLQREKKAPAPVAISPERARQNSPTTPTDHATPTGDAAAAGEAAPVLREMEEGASASTFGLARDLEADLPVETELSRHGLGPAPPVGARSLAEARNWWEQQNPGDSLRDAARKADRGAALLSSDAEPDSDADAISDGRAVGGPAADSPSPEDRFLDDALAHARNSTDDRAAREALRVLSGDFPENRIRETAWFELLQREGPSALASDDSETVIDVARSCDAFRLRYPHRHDILELRARVWVHVARLGVERSCAGARQRVYEWRDQETSDLRKGEATVLRGALDRICGD